MAEGNRGTVLLAQCRSLRPSQHTHTHTPTHSADCCQLVTAAVAGPKCFTAVQRNRGKRPGGESSAASAAHQAAHPGLVQGCAMCRDACMSIVGALDAGFALGKGR